MTEEEIKHWFSYHPPTDETMAKYEEIRDMVKHCEETIATLLRSTAQFQDRQAAFKIVGEALYKVALTIFRVCPECADRTAAIRCVRLSRMAINEALVLIFNGVSDKHPLAFNEALRQFTSELQKARWQANAAIACYQP